MELIYVISLLAGLLFLCAVVLIVFIVKNANKAVLISEQARQIKGLDLSSQTLTNLNNQLMTENAHLKTAQAGAEHYFNEKLRDIEQNKQNMLLQFRDIANQVLKSQTQQINETQRSSLEILLKPFQEQLQTFRQEVNAANKENTRNKLSFDEQFKILADMNHNLSKDAQNLADALRGNKKMQGNWGEIELNRLLEVSGLQKNIDYFCQENFKNEDNHNLRPDVIVRLPNNRSVIIDSKVSMNDYILLVNAENEADRAIAVQRHIQCIKNHIDELSGKEYQKLLKDESLDYVVIFIPIESAFVDAIKEDPTLYDYAYKKNIALTTPSSLLPILRTVENLWRIENQNKYVQKIADVGGSLYDKLANFVEDMQKIDKAIGAARQNYENAISKLANGKGNALSLAQRLKDYGAKANKNINIEFENTANNVLTYDDITDEKAS